MKPVSRSAVVLALAALATACQPPSPQEVAAQTEKDVDSLLTSAIATARTTNTWSSIDSTYTMGERVGTVRQRPTVPADTSSNDLMRWLRKYTSRIFTDANVVSSGGGATVFGVTGDIICFDPEYPQYPASAECVRQVNAAQLKLKVTAGIDITLQVGPQNIEPIIVRIRPKSLSYEVDLAKSQQASAVLSQAFGQSWASWSMVSKGRYEMKLEKFDELDHQVSINVYEPIEVMVTDDRGIQRGYTTQARSPIASLRIEGQNRRATAVANFGLTTYRGVGTDWFGYSSTATAPLEAKLAGFTAQAIWQDGQAQQLNNVSFGDSSSTVTFAGQTILAVDMNAACGRKVEGKYSRTVSGTDSFTLTPSLSVTAQVSMAPLIAYGINIEEPWRNTTYVGEFSALTDGVELQWLRPTNSFSGAFKLAKGSLSLSSNNPAYARRLFPEGVCLGGGDHGTNYHPLMDLFAMVPCPTF